MEKIVENMEFKKVDILTALFNRCSLKELIEIGYKNKENLKLQQKLRFQKHRLMAVVKFKRILSQIRTGKKKLSINK